MAFCRNCGASVDGRFCSQCGAAVTPAGGPEAAGATSGPALGAMSDQVASALCYVLGLITGILFLVLAPYNQNSTIRFHAFQSIFLHAAVILSWIVLNFFFSLTVHFVGAVLSPLIVLGFLVLWLYMILKAYQGQKIVLPVIGPLAEQQASRSV